MIKLQGSYTFGVPWYNLSPPRRRCARFETNEAELTPRERTIVPTLVLAPRFGATRPVHCFRIIGYLSDVSSAVIARLLETVGLREMRSLLRRYSLRPLRSSRSSSRRATRAPFIMGYTWNHTGTENIYATRPQDQKLGRHSAAYRTTCTELVVESALMPRPRRGRDGAVSVFLRVNGISATPPHSGEPTRSCLEFGGKLYRARALGSAENRNGATPSDGL